MVEIVEFRVVLTDIDGPILYNVRPNLMASASETGQT
jgi:hypothetical protein